MLEALEVWATLAYLQYTQLTTLFLTRNKQINTAKTNVNVNTLTPDLVSNFRKNNTDTATR